MKAKPSAGFMNVDLEITSRSKLTGIEKAIEDKAHALYSGPIRRGVFLLALECNRFARNADAAIIYLCTAIEGLPKAERRTWDEALSCRFDVGCRLLHGSRSEHVVLEEASIKRIVAIGGTVAFTCYRDFDSEPVAHANAGSSRG